MKNTDIREWTDSVKRDYIMKNIPRTHWRFFTEEEDGSAPVNYFNFLQLDLVGGERNHFMGFLRRFLEDAGPNPQQWGIAHLYKAGMASRMSYEQEIRRLTRDLLYLNSLASDNGARFLNYRVDRQNVEDCLDLLTCLAWYYPEYYSYLERVAEEEAEEAAM